MEWQREARYKRADGAKKAGIARFPASSLAGYPVPGLPVHPWSARSGAVSKGIIPFSSGCNAKTVHAGLLANNI
jgi:hypothetical protein